jgi:hypothetical protein
MPGVSDFLVSGYCELPQFHLGDLCPHLMPCSRHRVLRSIHDKEIARRQAHYQVPVALLDVRCEKPRLCSRQ